MEHSRGTPQILTFLVLWLSSSFCQSFGQGQANDIYFSKGGLTVVSAKSALNALDYVLESDGKVLLRGQLGLALPNIVGQAATGCDPGDADECLSWGDFAEIKLTAPEPDEDNCAQIEWLSTFGRRLEDCFDLEDGVHWYGGAETRVQTWPIELVSRDEEAYVTGDFLQPVQFGGLLEHYWLASSGVAIKVDEESPLFTSWNTSQPNKFCLAAQDQFPYTERNEVRLKYELCAAKSGENFKNVHQRAFAKHYSKPSDIPDEGMLVHPYWSTWAEYKTEINQSLVIELAKRLIEEGYTQNSHIEIDDNWESCYGEATFNREKFPDPAGMVAELKTLGIERTTMWIHPFINFDCPSFAFAFSHNYFVQDAKSKPGITGWWQGWQSGIIDFTNPSAVDFWTERLRSLQDTFGITSFKFDAGESLWLPPSIKLSEESNSKLFPNLYSTKYVQAVSAFGGMVETRTGHRNQDVPIFIRMLDKDSRWDNNNGLQSLIPTLLLFSVLGYSYVLPDMIGGNAYGDPPEPELYIRWAQANVFMPSWQFSVLPWGLDSTGVLDRVVKEAVDLREQYGSKILDAARQSVQDGSPMNRPMWWVDPDDPVTYTISDQFMLGDDILSAPVVTQGALTRNIYLPKGTWVVGGSGGGQTFTGPLWLENYPVPIDVLPFFEKIA